MESPAIVFFHLGSTPYFLRCTIESARFFNPKTRIILITDQPEHPFLIRLKVEFRSPKSLLHPLLKTFQKRYVHLSGIKEYYERIFLARWFYLDALIVAEKLQRAIYLDSDCMLFAKTTELFSLMPSEKKLSASSGGGPACTFIQGSLQPFLNFILDKYLDQDFIEFYRLRHEAATARGGLCGLGDMEFLNLFTRKHEDGYGYDCEYPTGFIDPCINVHQGFEYMRIEHRKRDRKKVFWEQINSLFLPYLKRSESGELVRVLALHYQSGAKRIIRRFNQVTKPSIIPLSHRRALYNWLHGGAGSQWM
jgi:hypothetical protein